MLIISLRIDTTVLSFKMSQSMRNYGDETDDEYHQSEELTEHEMPETYIADASIIAIAMECSSTFLFLFVLAISNAYCNIPAIT
jgi:hypothetical protein